MSSSIRASSWSSRSKSSRRNAGKRRRFPEDPQKDVLLFLLENAPLENWQRDVLWMIREEAYYFAPQAQTKIMNEGWATYWHAKIMTERALKDAEVIDLPIIIPEPWPRIPDRSILTSWASSSGEISKTAGTKASSARSTTNATTTSTKREWDNGLGLGREKIFETRRVHNDITFIDAFFTEEFCHEAQVFHLPVQSRTRRLRDRRPQLEEREAEAAVLGLTNFGQPFIYVTDGNFENRGELLLEHRHEGIDLRIDYAKDTLKNLFSIWSRPVHLKTAGRRQRARCSRSTEKNISRGRSMDEVKVTTDIEATDQLGMLVKRVKWRSPRQGDLRKQAAAIVEKIDYLGSELKVIEVDGVSNAVQIRSKKPAEDGYIEIILRGGNYLSLERKGAPLHISKGDFERLIRDLKEIIEH